MLIHRSFKLEKLVDRYLGDDRSLLQHAGIVRRDYTAEERDEIATLCGLSTAATVNGAVIMTNTVAMVVVPCEVEDGDVGVPGSAHEQVKESPANGGFFDPLVLVAARKAQRPGSGSRLRLTLDQERVWIGDHTCLPRYVNGTMPRSNDGQYVDWRKPIRTLVRPLRSAKEPVPTPGMPFTFGMNPVNMADAMEATGGAMLGVSGFSITAPSAKGALYLRPFKNRTGSASTPSEDLAAIHARMTEDPTWFPMPPFGLVMPIALIT